MVQLEFARWGLTTFPNKGLLNLLDLMREPALRLHLTCELEILSQALHFTEQPGEDARQP